MKTKKNTYKIIYENGAIEGGISAYTKAHAVKNAAMTRIHRVKEIIQTAGEGIERNNITSGAWASLEQDAAAFQLESTQRAALLG